MSRATSREVFKRKIRLTLNENASLAPTKKQSYRYFQSLWENMQDAINAHEEYVSLFCISIKETVESAGKIAQQSEADHSSAVNYTASHYPRKMVSHQV